MSRKFQCKSIPSTWLLTNGRRLDCGPYLSGAIEAKEALKQVNLDKQPLKQLTSGIYHAGRESRQWVETPEYGTCFMSSTDILSSDLTTLPLISKKQVISNPNFVIGHGWTLITRSGTIGRMAYARKEMDGLACSEHVMRVVPNNDVVLPGYIFAYLSSKFGVPLVVSGTYGSIIQSIEPHHIADLPVPRLGDIENRAHELVEQAAQLRTAASEQLGLAGQLLNENFDFPHKLALSHRIFSYTLATSKDILRRLDATYHDSTAQESDSLIRRVAHKDKLSDLNVKISETGRIKQVFVDEEYGAPFLTSGEIFRLRYEPTRFLSKRLLPDPSEWETQEEDILVARSGQVGGIIGRSVWADSRFSGGCVSVDVLRISAQSSDILPGYLYAYLSLTDVGYRQLIRTAAGSSIPHLTAPDILNLMIPRCELPLETEIDAIVRAAGLKRAEAQVKEDEARYIVEQAIEGGGH